MLAATLLAACSGSDSANDVLDGGHWANDIQQNEIRVTSNVNKMLDGTRATTYDSETLMRSDNIKIFSFFKDTEISYLSSTGVTLHYDAADPAGWKFWAADAQVHYYWPIEGSIYNPESDNITVSSLDFVGYYPFETPSYITADPTYTGATHNVTFTCSNLPMTYSSAAPTEGQGSNLKEFMFSVLPNQTQATQTAAGGALPMQFKHTFARIKMQLAASHPDIQINSITFKSIKNNGSFTYNYSASTSTWTPSGDAINLMMTLTGDAATFDNNPATTTPIGPDFIVIPQGWTGQIEVNASWKDWGDDLVPHTVSTTIPAITWEAGKSYTYTFNISPDDLVVNVTNYTEQW